MRVSTLARLSTSFAAMFIITALFFVCVPAANASEDSLIQVFTHLGFTNVAATTTETFPAGTYNITLYAEFAGYHEENELSYYIVETGTLNPIFLGPEGNFGYLNPPITKVFTANSQFGLSMLSPGPHRYFTETGKNPDGQQHSKIYVNQDKPGMFLIGFENLYGAGDRDYNDLVFSIQMAEDPPVGGIEVLMPYSADKTQLTCYSILTVLGIVLGVFRNKRKQAS